MVQKRCSGRALPEGKPSVLVAVASPQIIDYLQLLTKGNTVPINPDDYDDPELLAGWFEDQRNHVLEYLEAEGVSFDDIEECVPGDPDFCVAPYVAVWPVMNGPDSDDVGCWVISGDLPTDYVSSDGLEDARAVLAHFARTWAEIAECIRTGREYPGMDPGPREAWAAQADVLEARANSLRALAEDDAVWDEEAYEDDEDWDEDEENDEQK